MYSHRYTFFLKLGCTPDEAQARRGLDLSLRGFVASVLTHLGSPTRLIFATSEGLTSTSMALKIMRVQNLRLFEVFAFRA